MGTALLVYRNRFSYLLVGAGCLLMFLLWAGSSADLVEGELLNSRIFSVFVLLFVVPVGIYVGFLAVQRTPVIAIEGDSLKLSHGVFPWRKAELHREEIESVSSDFIPESTKCNLIIVLKETAPSNLLRSRVWLRTKNRECFFSLSNTTVPPKQVEEAISRWLENG